MKWFWQNKEADKTNKQKSEIQEPSVDGYEKSLRSLKPSDKTIFKKYNMTHFKGQKVVDELPNPLEIEAYDPSAQEPVSSDGFKPGDIIFDEFRIEKKLGQGGMGAVWLVTNLNNGQRFALKTSILAEESITAFIKELEVWTHLPPHPHLTAYRFSRTAGDRLFIFAEYIEGGSLLQLIRENRLNGIEQILDVAIQFAWGLKAAHNYGVIHQDVKPGNVLIAHDMTIKVCDFGLAKARAVSQATVSGPVQNILVSVGGMTRAYCSPEQARHEKLSHKSDQYSFAVSVLQMFICNIQWQDGTEAGKALERFVNQCPGVMPQGLADILEKCLSQTPEKRWDSMADVANALILLYRKATGKEYNRHEPAIAPMVCYDHDRRTTTGVRWIDPMVWLRQALQAQGKDPTQVKKLWSPGNGSRKTQAITDMAGYETARQIFKELIQDGHKELEHDLAILCMNKAFIHGYTEDYSGALELYDQAIKIYDRLVNQQDRSELANALAMAYMNKANAVQALGQYQQALELYDQAIIKIRDRLVNQQGRTELANAYMNKAIAVSNLGQYEQAIELYDQAIKIRDQLVNQQGRSDLANELADAYTNKAIAVWALGRNEQAIELYDQTIKIYDRLVNQQGRSDLANDLAMAYMNKAIAVKALGQYEQAIELYDQAIKITDRLVNQQGRTELANKLAMAYMNKAIAVWALGRNEQAIELYDQTIKITDRLVNQQGRSELKGDLAWVQLYWADTMNKVGRGAEAKNIAQKAFRMLQEEVKRTGRADLKSVVNWASRNLADILK